MRYFALVLAIALVLLVTAIASAQSVVTMRLDEQNNSGIDGSATLVAQGKQTKVVIDLANEPAGASMPAHIHQGQCGPTLNPKPTYPLHNVEDGTSTTVINAPLQSLSTGSYAINVHQSATDLQRTVACGNIPPNTTG